MASQGTTTIDFGAFPGKTDATIVVTGQTGILVSSLVEAWIFPVATADHSADEHLIDPPRVIAGNIVAGTGFTIYGFMNTRTDINNINSGQPMVYGLWTVAWVWN
jgi:hypothetical protein